MPMTREWQNGFETREAGGTRSGGLAGIVSFLLLFSMVAAIAFAMYLKSLGFDLNEASIKELTERFLISNLMSRKNEELPDGKVFEIEYDMKDHPVFCAYKDSIIKCGRDYIKALDKKGAEIWTKPVSMRNPLVKTNGPLLLVADIGGKDIFVISGRNVKWEESANERVINVGMNEDGYVTVVQEGRDCRNRVRVFDPKGIEMFSRSIQKNFVFTACVSPSGEQFFISSLDISGAVANPVLEFFDMRGNLIAARIPDSGAIFPVAGYLDNDFLAAASDSLIVCFDSGRNEVWRKEFDRIYSLEILLGKYIAAAVSGSKSSTGNAPEIQIFTMKGDCAASGPIEGEIRNIRVYEDIIAVNTSREVYFINAKGSLIRKYGFKTDVLDVHFFSRLEAMIVAKNTITIVRIG